ncbi:MAG: TetR/AcrR family transcriptional regulator [Thermoleophilaceae bacterium]|nr:TetR/AcrR family transcriptional regulator [Thermoleophilaceae bacterium]
MDAARGRGRPRDPETDERIVRCALDQLAEDGYAGMSIDGVARAAGVSKATIYRRFTDKNDLVTAAIATYAIQDVEDLRGDTREQLIAMMQAARERMIDGPGMMIMRQILAEAQRNPELVRLHRERTIQPKMAVMVGVLEQGIERGEVRPDADLQLIAELLSGSWMARWNRGEAFPPDWSERVVDAIWPAISA